MKKILLAVALLSACSSLAFEIPKRSSVLPGYNESAAKARLARNTSDRMEGLWYYPDEKLTLAIEKIDTGERGSYYRLTVVDADDCAVDCGSIMGYMEQSAMKSKLRLWLYSGLTDDLLVNPIECVATVDDEYSTILIDRPSVKLRFSVNLTQFLPSIFRGLRVYPRYESEKIKPGFRKITSGSESSDLIYF